MLALEHHDAREMAYEALQLVHDAECHAAGLQEHDAGQRQAYALQAVMGNELADHGEQGDQNAMMDGENDDVMAD